MVGIGLLAGVITVAQAERRITLPHRESFEGEGSVSDISWASQGGAVLWERTGGWRGGGGIRVAPTILDEGYAGVGSFTGFAPQTRLNVRWLMYFGSSFQQQVQSSKLLILHRQNIVRGFQRPMIIDDERIENGQVQRYWFPAIGYGNGPHSGQDRFHVSGSEYADEWVCFEYEADLVAKRINLYIHTQDGRYRGLSNSLDMFVFEEDGENGTHRPPAEFPIYEVQILGGYWGRVDGSELGVPPAQRDVNAYVKFDELVIDNGPIGCPTGFLSNPPPAAPSRLR